MRYNYILIILMNKNDIQRKSDEPIKYSQTNKFISDRYNSLPYPGYKDSKRVLNKKEKEMVYNDAPGDVRFDDKYFKKDVNGYAIIKDIAYNNNPDLNRKFANEYEHIMPHSAGGKTIPENTCLLNAGNNRRKKDRHFGEITPEEDQQYKNENCVSFNELYKNIEENGTEKVSKEYNINLIINEDEKISVNVVGYKKNGNNIYEPYYKNDKDCFIYNKYMKKDAPIKLRTSNKENIKRGYGFDDENW